MASYHCTVKAGASGGAASHDAYIEREGKYNKDREDLEHVESGNLPSWASTSADFWKSSDLHERANAKGYQEYEVALPRELLPEQRVELVRAFVRQEIGDRHTYTFAIHNPKATLEGGEQPHAHIMFSDRHLDGIERPAEQHFKRYNAKNPEKGGCRKGEGAMTGEERTAQLLGIRERWATLQNKHLEMHGSTARVDHRSLKDQGIDREPERHLGARQIQADTPAVERVLQARADRTLSSMLDRAIGAAQRRLTRLNTLARGLIARASAKVPSTVDQVEELMGCVAQIQTQREAVIQAGKVQAGTAQKDLERHQAAEATARKQIGSMVAPGMLALPGTKKKFELELAQLKQQGQAALDAQAAAKAKLDQAEKMQTNPLPFVQKQLSVTQPGLWERYQKLKREPHLAELAKTRILEAQAKAQLVKDSTRTPFSQPPRALQDGEPQR